VRRTPIWSLPRRWSAARPRRTLWALVGGARTPGCCGQVEEAAISRERQRLIRDLHDAVNQIHAVGLIAEVLPRIYERNPEQGRQRLEELGALTQEVSAQMQALILELQPAVLADAALPDLLRQLGQSAYRRARIPVKVEVDEHWVALPVEVREASYHVAREALNNVARHSGANKGGLALVCPETGVRLIIEDDGVGFDPGDTGPGRLGFRIMREQAASLGATLDVHSAPGKGTRIVMSWSPPAGPPSR